MKKEILVIPQTRDFIEDRIRAANDYFRVALFHRDFNYEYKHAKYLALYVIGEREVAYIADILGQTVGTHHETIQHPVCVWFIVQDIRRLKKPVRLGTINRTKTPFYTNWDRLNSAETTDDLKD